MKVNYFNVEMISTLGVLQGERKNKKMGRMCRIMPDATQNASNSPAGSY